MSTATRNAATAGVGRHKPEDLRSFQMITGKQVAAGIAVTIVYFYSARNYLVPAVDCSNPLGFAVRCLVISALSLFLGVLLVGNYR